RQFLTAPLRFELRTLALGDIGMRDDGPTFRHVQRYDGNREPALAVGHATGILEREAFSGPVQHRLDPNEHLADVEGPLAGGASAHVEIAHAHPGLRRPTIFAGEAHPAVVDHSDPALAIQYGDVAAEGGEDGRLHQLARAHGILRLLAREGVRKNPPDETEALTQLVCPGPLDRERHESETTENAAAGHHRNGEVRTNSPPAERLGIVHRFRR